MGAGYRGGVEEPGPSLLQRIAACRDLTTGERAVASFYEDSYPGAALLNLQDVCAATGVSTATVTRFARKLGYADFRGLRRSLRAEARSHLDVPRDRLARLGSRAAGRRATTATTASTGPTATTGSAKTSAPTHLEQRFAVAAGDLGATARGVDPAVFEQVVGLIADTDRPLVLGAVASGQPLLHYFSLLLSYVRGDVTLLDGADRWAHSLAGLQPNAVVIGAAFDRYPVPVQRLLRFARGRGATTVLITNRRSSPLTTDADLSLFVASHADPMFRSRVGLLFLLEALLDAVADRIPQVERAADVERVFSLMGGYLTSGDSADPGSLSDN